MGFRQNCYCTCWADKQTGETVAFKEKSARIKVSTSRKGNDGKYVTDFSGYVTFAGAAFEKLRTVAITDKTRLHLTAVDVTNQYDKTTGRSTTTFWCYDFEPKGEAKATPKETKVVEDTTKQASADDDWAGLPF